MYGYAGTKWQQRYGRHAFGNYNKTREHSGATKRLSDHTIFDLIFWCYRVVELVVSLKIQGPVDESEHVTFRRCMGRTTSVRYTPAIRRQLCWSLRPSTPGRAAMMSVSSTDWPVILSGVIPTFTIFWNHSSTWSMSRRTIRKWPMYMAQLEMTVFVFDGTVSRTEKMYLSANLLPAYRILLRSDQPMGSREVWAQD